ncbi:MAG TPA: biosynthetic peptidoglycan transglycosylase [Kofleriaceae bacterium]|nr:biosynthetic peptidoglycan transglycosylase [Kofleriaceae bacterium]
MKVRREYRIAATTAVLAVGVPVGAACWIGARTHDLADHVGERGGIHARIGAVDADLTGTIRLTDVALGDLFAAEAVEASVALDSLLAGHVSADEIRVAAPRIAVEVDRDGDSDLARLVRRLGRRDPNAKPSTATHVRRIVVTSGTLTARVAGIGELSADDVELVPDGHGVRLITGKLRVRAGNDRVHGEIELARSAADVSLPRVTFGRVLAVAGTGRIEIGGRSVTLRDIAIGRLELGGALEARGFLDDSGVPRAVGAELVPPAPDHPGFALTVSGDKVPLAPFASLAPHGLVLDGSRASGQLTVRRANATVQLAMHGSVAGVHIDHKAIAPQPLAIDAALDTALAVSPDAVVVDHAALTIGAAQWSTSGWVRRGTPLSGQLDVRLATAPCNDLLASLPVEVRGPLDGLTLTGTFGGRARLAIDLAAPAGEGVELDTALTNACEVTAEPPAADVRKLADRPPGDKPWVELKKLDGYVPGAFISAEDGRFYDHHGFDVTQIARSLEIDLRDHRLARGGSTISQQLVKNELLTHRRSLDRKIQEALLTWRLEARLAKKQILERYLNIIELGPKVRGIVEAAHYWFDVSSRDLSIRQAAFLAALTSEPQTMSRRVRHAGGLDADSAARVDTVLRAMRRDGVISKDELETARDKPLRFASTALRREI